MCCESVREVGLDRFLSTQGPSQKSGGGLGECKLQGAVFSPLSGFGSFDCAVQCSAAARKKLGHRATELGWESGSWTGVGPVVACSVVCVCTIPNGLPSEVYEYGYGLWNNKKSSIRILAAHTTLGTVLRLVGVGFVGRTNERTVSGKS